MSDIKAIFFDFGGVIARLDREQVRALEERYGLPRGGLLEALYGIPEWQEAERGLLPEEKWLQAVLRRLEEMAGRPIPDIQKDWHIVWRQLDQEVLELARRLRQRYVVGIISNSTPRLEREVLQPKASTASSTTSSTHRGWAWPSPTPASSAWQQRGLDFLPMPVSTSMTFPRTCKELGRPASTPSSTGAISPPLSWPCEALGWRSEGALTPPGRAGRAAAPARCNGALRPPAPARSGEWPAGPGRPP